MSLLIILVFDRNIHTGTVLSEKRPVDFLLPL
jgi:hypothetical protein